MKEGCPVLSQCPEGFLGKLQIRKSGKVELKLGDVTMDVSDGAAFSFLQVVCVCVAGGGHTLYCKLLQFYYKQQNFDCDK